MAKTFKKIIFCVIFFSGFLVWQNVQAATHYVSPSGTATWANSTNIDTPCSLSTANTNAAAGDTVYLRGGTYIITGDGIKPTHSGTAGNVITYSAYGSEAPIIYGADYVDVNNWGGRSSIGINLTSSTNYIKVTKITFTNVGAGFHIDGGGHHEISYCTFTFRDPWADIEQTGTATNAETKWASLHNYSLNDVVVPTTSTKAQFFYKLTTDNGSSGATEPTWSTTIGGTTVDGGLIWTTITNPNVPVWQPGHTYNYGDAVKPVTENGYVYLQINSDKSSGTSGGTEPTWPTVIQTPPLTVVDGGITWQVRDVVNILIDSARSWTPNSSNETSRRIYNATDKSTIDMPNFNTATTITATSYPLAGGKNNYWTNGDVYQVTLGYPYDPAVCDIGGTSTNNWIHHNTIHGGGGFTLFHDGAPLFQIGPDAGASEYNNNNTIEYNHIYDGGHHVFGVNKGLYNVIRRNYVHSEAFFSDASYSGLCTAKENGVCGYRDVSTGVDNPAYGGHGLWEDNRFGHAAQYGGTHLVAGGASGSGVTLATPSNIYRFNDHFNNAEFGLRFGSSMGNNSAGNRVYNNTFYHLGYRLGVDPYTLDDYRTGILFYGTGTTNVAIKNNLFYGMRSQNAHSSSYYCPAIQEWTSADPTNNTIANNYMNTSAGYAHSYSPISEMADPLFTNPSLPASNADYSSVIRPFTTAWPNVVPDLTLQGGSPAIDGGTYLTTASGARNSSTSLVVADASYFQDGTWGSDLARGSAGNFYSDWIAIDTVNNFVQISSINYSTNTITLASPMTWADNAHIWLYKKSDGAVVLAGTAPDYGAHEYISGSTDTTPPAAPTGLAVS